MASEVKSLTDEAATAVHGIGTHVGDFSEIIKAGSGSVEEQDAAMQEISRNIREAADSSRTGVSNIDGTRRAAGDTDSLAQAVQAAVDGLAHQVEVLQKETTDLAAQLQAA